MAKNYAVLEVVREKLVNRVMPPAGKLQPADAETREVIAWLDACLDELAGESGPYAGHTPIRRLNRAEYDNTIHDLLGVTFRLPNDFPREDIAYGFDNNGSALSLSQPLLERYFDMAEMIAHQAIFGADVQKPTMVSHQPWYGEYEKSKEAKRDYDETGMSLPNAVHVTQYFPVEGDYVLRGVLRGFRPKRSEPAEIGIWLDGKLISQSRIPVPSDGEMNGLWAECRTHITAGEHWMSVTVLRLYEGLPAAYKGPNPSKKDVERPVPPKESGLNLIFGVPESNKTDMAPAGFFVQNLNITGPYNQAKGATRASLEKVYVCGHFDGHHEAGCARKVVTDLAYRAYRRPPTEAEIADLLKLVKLAQNNGDSFEEGLCLALERILVSPSFLFRIENESADGLPVANVSNYELASRLSYFLWSSTPDDTLLRLAADKTLSQPKVLEAQVERMLSDGKSRAFVDNFAGQWLQFRELDNHEVNRKLYPQYTDYTRMSMKQESSLFFDSVVRDNLSIFQLIDADYTFLNQRLAEFYQIPGVTGHEFRKVGVSGSKRGGILTQGSILAVSSFPNRTSPVLRGKWILENVLNSPPAPPPAQTPPLDVQKAQTPQSLRKEMESHRASPQCVSCHARMDPLGFALDGFDAVGAWRETLGGSSIDDSATLPDGRSFKGVDGLKKILLAERTAFAKCFTEKMLTYALGRGLNFRDRGTVHNIVARLALNDYRMRTLILEVVKSVPFQMRERSK